VKVIFLDIDGVLNSQLYAEKHLGEDNQADSSVPHPMSEIDPVSVGFLNSLIEDTGAVVVVSSTWRLNRSVEELQDILNQRGFTGKIVGLTPSLHRLEPAMLRGNEIYKWIEDNIQYEERESLPYVIFDDDSDMLYWQRNNFILVDAYCGLTPNQIYKAKRILGEIKK